MGEWSEHFERFPDEDPANEVRGVYSQKYAEKRSLQAQWALQPKALTAVERARAEMIRLEESKTEKS